MYQKENAKKTIRQIACDAFVVALESRDLAARDAYLKETLGEDGPRYVATLKRMATPEEARLDIIDLFGYEEISRQMAKPPTNVIVIRDKDGNPKLHASDYGIRRIYPTKGETSSAAGNLERPSELDWYGLDISNILGHEEPNQGEQ